MRSFFQLAAFYPRKSCFLLSAGFSQPAMGDAYHCFNRHLGKITLIVSETSQTVSGENVPFQASLS